MEPSVKENREREIAAPFIDWGMDTAELLPAVHNNCPALGLIGSGGVRHGLDIASVWERL
ncbi:MAG: isopentenyl-diphosphate delta-isomerase [Gammaproteobacteria bacterium]